jgi:tRNA A-37 threonylcarbamoyl transferase component Bud32
VDPTQVRQIDRYEVVRFVAEGSFCRVFEVVDPTVGAHRALKILKREALNDTDEARFLGESDLLASLNHTNIVDIFDRGTDPDTGLPYYVMTLVDGPTLQQRIWQANEGRETAIGLPVDEVVRIFGQVLSGLARIHEAGVVHRDMKPANILLMRDGTAMVADLGIARVDGSGATRTGVAMGTALYMSPEQAQGQRAQPHSDVFAVGLCMYHALHGYSVYDLVQDLDSQSGPAILGQLIYLRKTGAGLPFEFGDQVPHALRNIIQRACQFEPENRYQDAGEMLDHLRQVTSMTSGGTITYDDTPPRRVRKRRTKLWAGLAAAAALGGVVALFATGVLELPDIGTQPLKPRLEAAEAQRTEVAKLSSAARAWNAPEDAIEAAEQQLEFASQDLGRAKVFLDRGQDDDAERRIDESEAALAAACDELVGVLGPAALEADQASQTNAAELGGLGAAKYFPAEWEAYQAKLAQAVVPAPASDACGRARGIGGQLEALGAVRDVGRDLDAKLSRVWPEMASEAREMALSAQRNAKAKRSRLPAWGSLMEAADERVAAGQAIEASDPRNAIDRYNEATVLFGQAPFVVAAHDVRRAAERAKKQLGRKYPDLAEEMQGPAGLAWNQANEAFESESWEEASTLFAKARDGFGSLQVDLAASAPALQEQARATKARDAAIEAKAETLAPEPLAEADTTFARAVAAFDEKHYAAAQKDYKEASRQFQRAGQAAAGAAGDVKRRARETADALGALAKGDCASIGSEDAFRYCEMARQSLAEADEEIEQEDWVAAGDWLDDASTALRRAQESVKTMPKPPVISAQVPRPDQRLRRGARAKLSVQATDPNNDPLDYRWTVNGKEVKEKGPALSLASVKEDSVVVVEVSDGQTPPATARWNLTLAANQKPKLQVSPRDRATAQVGDAVSFTATASDPDGDKPKVTFQRDGKVVSEGKSWRFQPDAAGEHVVVVQADDGQGGVTTVRRTLVVTDVPVVPQNRPPSVKVQVGSSGDLSVGDSRSYSVKASDPDGDPVKLEVRVGGVVVASGTESLEYDYEAAAAGDHVVEIRATDGKERVVRRLPVKVASPIVPDPDHLEMASLERREPPEPPPPPPTIQPPREPPPPDAEIRALLQAWGQAWGACDLARLSQLMPMSSIEKKLWEANIKKRCEPCGGYQVDTMVREIDVQDKTARANADNHMRCNSDGRLVSYPISGQFVRRPDGSWSIRNVVDWRK